MRAIPSPTWSTVPTPTSSISFWNDISSPTRIEVISSGLIATLFAPNLASNGPDGRIAVLRLDLKLRQCAAGLARLAFGRRLVDVFLHDADTRRVPDRGAVRLLCLDDLRIID